MTARMTSAQASATAGGKDLPLPRCKVILLVADGDSTRKWRTRRRAGDRLSRSAHSADRLRSSYTAIDCSRAGPEISLNRFEARARERPVTPPSVHANVEMLNQSSSGQRSVAGGLTC